MKEILSAKISRQMFKDVAAGDVRSFSSEILPDNCLLFVMTDENGAPMFDDEKGEFIPRHYDAVRFQHDNLFLKQSVMASVEDIHIRVISDGMDVPAENDGEPHLRLMVDITLGDLLPKDHENC